MTTQDNTMLPFTNDFIFSLVMRNPEICKGILERILPETEISNITLSPSEHPLLWDDSLSVETQKSLKFASDIHGVRFDAYIQSENMWAEIEMQTATSNHIGKRSRYYHANMDIDFLEAGMPYKDLKKSYVIFICTFDYMKKGAPVYHFRNFDNTTGTYLDDDSHTIILNMTLAHLMEQAEDRMAQLARILLESDRDNDLLHAAQDPEYRKKLFEEFSL